MLRFKILLNLWTPVLLWMVLIFTFSSIQVGSASEFYWKDFIVKKTAHLIEYGILAILLYRAIKNSGVEKKKAICYSILIAFFYGLTDEFHQSFTPGRGPKLTDVVIDTLGAIIGLSIFIKNEKINI